MLLVVLSVPTGLIVVVNNEYVQNVVMQKVTKMLSEKLGNHVTIGHIRLSWFNQLIVNDLNVTGLNGDTILNAPEL
ncbi:MAG: hypothetical protein LBV39_00740, partial [Bacteroidales bacterium]|nr:hypothetical protein [Bacteroidales bacterium]